MTSTFLTKLKDRRVWIKEETFQNEKLQIGDLIQITIQKVRIIPDEEQNHTNQETIVQADHDGPT